MSEKRPAGMYKLRRPFYDGDRLHSRGAVLHFAEGAAPSTASPMKEVEKKNTELVEDGDDEDEQLSFSLDSAIDVNDVGEGDTMTSITKRSLAKKRKA